VNIEKENQMQILRLKSFLVFLLQNQYHLIEKEILSIRLAKIENILIWQIRNGYHSLFPTLNDKLVKPTSDNSYHDLPANYFLTLAKYQLYFDMLLSKDYDKITRSRITLHMIEYIFNKGLNIIIDKLKSINYSSFI
jgi:hypothetical protein